MSIHRSRTRVIYLLIWFGASLSLMAYAQTARIGTGLFIILGGIVIMLLAILGIVFALHEESGKQGSSQKEEAHRGVMTGRDTGEEEAKRLWVVPKQKMLAELKEDEA